MKSGIVMEVKKGKVILLTKDGCFVSVRIPPGRQPAVGSEYHSSYFAVSKKRPCSLLPSFSLTLILFLVFFLISGMIPIKNENEAAAAYVSFDVNPSLEVGVNSRLEVIDVQSWNHDAADLLNKIRYKEKMSLSSFSGQLIDAFNASGYLNDRQDVMIVTTVVDPSNKKLSSSLKKTIATIKRNKIVANHQVTVNIKEADSEKHQKASDNNISTGKYLLYLDAKNKGQKISLKDVQKKTFSELKRNIEISNKPNNKRKNKTIKNKVIHKHNKAKRPKKSVLPKENKEKKKRETVFVPKQSKDRQSRQIMKQKPLVKHHDYKRYRLKNIRHSSNRHPLHKYKHDLPQRRVKKYRPPHNKRKAPYHSDRGNYIKKRHPQHLQHHKPKRVNRGNDWRSHNHKNRRKSV
ncbi:anti-sigma-I factor RsgI family protein [Fictibacillus gelatini]|uniref:anti-sigma-I factor RsgI family protein n=1 Tax=Fictibacillus gelatini TaxID=225985 RepID=UPI000425D5FF|nr:hypothetical protein [Fictibacillus gelatini]